MYGKTMLLVGVTDVCNAVFFVFFFPELTVRAHLGLRMHAQGFPDVN